MIKIKAVIFDRDGIIVDTNSIVIESVSETFQNFGFELTPEDRAFLIGVSRDIYLPYFASKWNFNEDEFRVLQKKIINKKKSSVKFYKYALDTIHKFHSLKIPLGLATSASSAGTKEILRLANLQDVFDAIVTRTDCVKHKPDPEVYIKAASGLNIDPKFCLAIEDTSIGVEAAKAAGMFCFAIPNEYTMNHDFSKADAVLNSASEIDTFVDLSRES